MAIEPSTQSSRGPRLGQSLWRLLFAVGYLAGIAWAFGAGARVSFVSTLLALLAGTVFTTTLALVWLTRSALRADGRQGQFGLGSLLFLTTFAAIYFGTVRWVVVHAARSPAVRPGEELGVFAIVGALCLVAAVVAVPIVFAAADSLVWFAVWLVRRPRVRRWLRARRPPRNRDRGDV